MSGRTLLLRQMDTTGRGYDALALTKAVAAADPLAGWPGVAGDAGALSARRGFQVDRPAGVSEALLRVSGVSDYRVRLNDVEVARGGLDGDAPESFSLPATLLRAGPNALAIEGFSSGGERTPPSLELTLVSPAPR